MLVRVGTKWSPKFVNATSWLLGDWYDKVSQDQHPHQLVRKPIYVYWPLVDEEVSSRYCVGCPFEMFTSKSCSTLLSKKKKTKVMLYPFFGFYICNFLKMLFVFAMWFCWIVVFVEWVRLYILTDDVFPQVGVRREVSNFRRPRKKKVKILNLRSFIGSVYCALTFPSGFSFTYPRCQIALVIFQAFFGPLPLPHSFYWIWYFPLFLILINAWNIINWICINCDGGIFSCCCCWQTLAQLKDELNELTNERIYLRQVCFFTTRFLLEHPLPKHVYYWRCLTVVPLSRN